MFRHISTPFHLTGLRLLRQLFLLTLLSSLSMGAIAEEKLTLNFTDTDINAVITAVAKLTGKNFIIDPRVKGKVTVITHEAMTRDEAYQVFLSMLKVHGFAAIHGENVTKIVPEVNAKQESIKTVQSARFAAGDELITQVIPIEYVSAAQLVPILRPLIPQQGHLAAYQQSNALIISDSASNVARLQQIIRRIDQSVSDEVEVIRLAHANATDVVRIVKQLRQPTPQAASSYNLIADERTNSVLLSGDKQERVRIRVLISHMDIPLEEGGGDTHVIYLRYANAVDMVDVLTGVSESFTKEKTISKAPQAGVTSTTALGSNVHIQADENNNALIIHAPAGVMRSLRGVIQQLDIRRAQIHVEAVLAEVSYEKAAEFGIQWAFDGSEGGTKNGPVGVLNFPSSGTPITGLLETPPLIGDGLTLGLGKFTNGELTLAAMVRAAAGDGNTNILSTPNLVTMDNEEASIVVGQNVPFLTGSYANTGGGSTPLNPFQTIERQDVGLTLRITPQINEGNTIKMTVDQEISTIAPSTEGVDLITNKRQIVTNVLVDNDQVLVLGGLMEDALQDSEQKIPYLGDVPVLGWMFKYNQVKKVKTNLMVFIHPTIIDDELIANDFTRSKYNYIRNKQIAQRDRGIALINDDEAPIMPALNAIPPLPPRYEPASSGGEIAPPGSL